MSLIDTAIDVAVPQLGIARRIWNFIGPWGVLAIVLLTWGMIGWYGLGLKWGWLNIDLIKGRSDFIRLYEARGVKIVQLNDQIVELKNEVRTERGKVKLSEQNRETDRKAWQGQMDRLKADSDRINAKLKAQNGQLVAFNVQVVSLKAALAKDTGPTGELQNARAARAEIDAQRAKEVAL